jgi:hypothetical protein
MLRPIRYRRVGAWISTGLHFIHTQTVDQLHTQLRLAPGLPESIYCLYRDVDGFGGLVVSMLAEAVGFLRV